MQLINYSKLSILLIISVSASLGACQYLFEFRAPREAVNFQVPSAMKGDDIYNEITNYIQAKKFKKMPILLDTQVTKGSRISHYSLFFNDGTGEYYKEFRFEEKTVPYVVSLQIDMNKDKTKMIYQFSEIDLKKGEKIPTIFSPEACGVIADLNGYVASLLGPDHMKISSSTSCVGRSS